MFIIAWIFDGDHTMFHFSHDIIFPCFSCSGVRPFGVSLLVAGYDDKGPQLYQVSYTAFSATASNIFSLFGCMC